MKRFFYNYNNGVTALVSEEVYVTIQKFNEIYRCFEDRDKGEPYEKRWRAEIASKAMTHLGKPVFTFSRAERAEESPWFTGDEKLLGRLADFIRENGGRLERGDFYVPFSNGCELGMHGRDSMEHELRYATTEQEFRETFGITIRKLSGRPPSASENPLADPLDINFSSLTK